MLFLLPGEDLEAIKRLGDAWGDWVTYIPLFHATHEEMIVEEGYGGESVAVTVRTECDEPEIHDDLREGEEDGDGVG